MDLIEHPQQNNSNNYLNLQNDVFGSFHSARPLLYRVQVIALRSLTRSTPVVGWLADRKMQSKGRRWFGEKVTETTAEEGFKQKNQNTI